MIDDDIRTAIALYKKCFHGSKPKVSIRYFDDETIELLLQAQDTMNTPFAVGTGKTFEEASAALRSNFANRLVDINHEAAKKMIDVEAKHTKQFEQLCAAVSQLRTETP